MGDRFIREGEGWRIGWNTTVSDYQGLLGGEAWAVELTASEFHTFQRLVMEISEAMGAIASELMEDEQIACEAEADGLWLEVEGLPSVYSLRFILETGRRCEGQWGPVASQQIIQAVHSLAVF